MANLRSDLATRAYVTATIAALVNGAPGLLDTLGEIASQLATDESAAAALLASLSTETTNRTNADSTLTTNLAAEATARAAGDALAIPLTQKAAASGVASLDGSTRLPLAQKALRVVSAKTAAYTVGTGDDIVVAGGTTAYTVTLPDAATVPGREFTVKRTSTGVITLGSAGGTIDAAATQALSIQNQSVTVVSDGANWQVI